MNFHHYHYDQGARLKQPEQTPKSPAAKTGFFATLSDSLRGGGSGAPALRLLALLALALTAGLTLAAPSASAAPVTTEFGTEGTRAGEFIAPNGIAIHQENGDVYLGDRNNNRVDQFGPGGEFLQAFGWGVADGAAELESCGPAATPPSATCRAGLAGAGAGQFSSPEGIAVDNTSGDVYVVDRENSRVEKFSSAGAFIRAWGWGVKDGASELQVCTTLTGCRAGIAGPGPGQFERLYGRAIAVGPGGSVYVGDENRVQRFSPAGALEAHTALPGVGFVVNLAVDSAGDLYVQNETFAGVRKYNQSGTELGAPRDKAGRPGPIAVGPTDQLFVRDGQTRQVLTFNSAGTQIAATASGEFGSQALAYGVTAESLYLVGGTSVRVLPPASPGVPYVVSESAGEIGATSATLQAVLNPEGEETTYYFEYGTTTSYEHISVPLPLGSVNEVQTVTVKATAGAYLLRFNGESTVEIPFNAEASEVQADLEALPAIGTGNVSVAGPSSGPYEIEFTAALGGSDQPQLEAESVSLKQVTEVEGEERIKPGTVSASTTRAGADSFADRPVSAPIAGLLPRTTYHYRVVAENAAAKVTKGPDQEFTTLPPVSIDATSVSLITATSARLEAELNPHGLPTTYHFEYDTVAYLEGEAPHGASTPTAEAGSGSADVAATADVAGLAPATTYHFRLVAENSLGKVEGPDRSFTTESTLAAALLPDGRAWELVSPPDKHGITLEGLSREGGLIQAAADGNGLAYIARGPILSEVEGNRSFSFQELLAQRGGGLWQSRDITTRHENPSGVITGDSSEYKYFSADLSRGFVQPTGATPLAPQATEPTPYLRETATGAYVPLVYPGNVPPGTKWSGPEINSEEFPNGVKFFEATPDGSSAILRSANSAPLTPGAPDSALYEWTDGSLTLVSEAPTAPATSCGGSGPACVPIGANLGSFNEKVRNAVSEDGDRVIFSAERGLYLRDIARGETVELNVPAPGAEGQIGQGEAVFQYANADGSRVFFTSDAKLTTDASAQGGQPDLYMCTVEVLAGQLSCTLKDLTVDSEPGGHADVRGMLIGANSNATKVYFAANGALAPGAVAGSCTSGFEAPPTTSCNLYVYDVTTEHLHTVAVVSNRDDGDWSDKHYDGRDLGGLTSRVSDNGRWFAFMSRRPLTGFDNRDLRTGEPDEEVFLYDASSATLRCVSCSPTGARPLGLFEPKGTSNPPLVDRIFAFAGQGLAASISGGVRIDGGTAFHLPRNLSDSGRLFFNAATPVVPQDTNGVEDVYQYEPTGVGSCTPSSADFGAQSGGCVSLISSGTSGEESAFLDASENGDDAFFLTQSRLTPRDVDGALDVYDARVGGGEPESVNPVECSGDSCQQPAVPPNDATPGSLTFNGAGNELKCPKGKVKKNGKCVAKKSKKHKKSHKKHTKKSHSRTAGHNRGGAK